jgi:hypothetical protein
VSQRPDAELLNAFQLQRIEITRRDLGPEQANAKVNADSKPPPAVDVTMAVMQDRTRRKKGFTRALAVVFLYAEHLYM